LRKARERKKELTKKEITKRKRMSWRAGDLEGERAISKKLLREEVKLGPKDNWKPEDSHDHHDDRQS